MTFTIEEIKNWLIQFNQLNLIQECNEYNILKSNSLPLSDIKDYKILSFKKYDKLISSGQDRGNFYFSDGEYLLGYANYPSENSHKYYHKFIVELKIKI